MNERTDRRTDGWTCGPGGRTGCALNDQLIATRAAMVTRRQRSALAPPPMGLHPRRLISETLARLPRAPYLVRACTAAAAAAVSCLLSPPVRVYIVARATPPSTAVGASGLACARTHVGTRASMTARAQVFGIFLCLSRVARVLSFSLSLFVPLKRSSIRARQDAGRHVRERRERDGRGHESGLKERGTERGGESDGENDNSETRKNREKRGRACRRGPT